MSDIEQPKIYSTLAGDKDFSDLLEEFVQELALRQQSLRECLSRGDTVAVTRLIHQLRGSCGGYGFSSLTQAAGIIDDQLRAGVPIEKTKQQIEDFIDSLSFVTAAPHP